jgi:putative ABC transport system permease protein
VSGLAMALIACMLIGLYIFDEWSVDKALPNGDRIVRVSTKVQDMIWAGTSAPISNAIAQDFPEVEASVRIMKFPELDQMLLRYSEEEDLIQFYESRGYYADSSLFSVMEFPMITGDANRALHNPSSIVLSSGLAKKIFGEINPLNQTLNVGLPFGDFDYTVTGVFDEHAFNSHFDPNFLLSMENQDFGNVVKNWTNWASNNIFYTYAKLLPETNVQHFESKLQDYYLTKAGEDMKALGIHKTVFVQPFREIYLHSNIDFELGKTGNATTLYVFGSIGLFILLIACINFMNLTTARSERRAREVGIRKLLGANRGELIRQFLIESVTTALIGFFLAAVAISFLLPNLGSLIGIEIHGQTNWIPWVLLLSLCVIAGVVAGIYPALFLSGFKPIGVLKGRFKGRISGFSLREVLVVVQFCISACLILMVFVIKNQLDFLQKQDLGFNQDQQLVVRLRSENAVENFETLKNQLLQHPEINAVSIASTYPGVESLEDMMYYAEDKSVDEVVHIRNSYVGNDFIETLGFELIEGKSFTSDLTSELPMIILNETAVKNLGYDVETAVGKKIHYDWIDQKHTLEIVGVVKDFHSQSLHKPIDPFGFRNGNRGGHLIANFNSNNPTEIINLANNIWEATGIVEPFSYSFLDQDFQRNYEKEAQTSKIIISFALLALFIACLGLYGLAAFMTEQRTKEIGIRKTLGATDWNIVRLLSSDFGKTVLLAILISIPVSVFLANRWLANFAFKIDLHWSYFMIAGLLALLIAMMTVSFQSIKTTLMNPVDSLRSE